MRALASLLILIVVALMPLAATKAQTPSVVDLASRRHGTSPLPVIGAGIPGILGVGAAGLIAYRKLRAKRS